MTCYIQKLNGHMYHELRFNFLKHLIAKMEGDRGMFG